MGTEPRGISAIVPTCNGARHVGELLASLAGTHGIPWEIVLVDDASTDETVEVAERFQAAGLPIEILRLQRRRGKAKAINHAVTAARFSKLAFLDQDDVATGGYLNALEEALEMWEFVCAGVELTHLNERHLVRAMFRPDTDYFVIPLHRDVGGEELAGVPVSMGGTLGISRKTFEEVGGFDPRAEACDDLDLCMRLWLRGVTLRPANATLNYRLRASLTGTFRQRLGYGRGWARLYDIFCASGMVRSARADRACVFGLSCVRLACVDRRALMFAVVAQAGFSLGLAMGKGD